MGSFLIGISLAFLFGIKALKSKKKIGQFVCGHCESKDTLQIQKVPHIHKGHVNVFTCSFCERVVDETLLKLSHREDYEKLIKDPEKYEELKKERKEGRK